jgi:hypothetical protein
LVAPCVHLRPLAQGLKTSGAGYGEVSEWPKEHAWKVCISQGIEGSTPSLTAIIPINPSSHAAPGVFYYPRPQIRPQIISLFVFVSSAILTTFIAKCQQIFVDKTR